MTTNSLLGCGVLAGCAQLQRHLWCSVGVATVLVFLCFFHTLPSPGAPSIVSLSRVVFLVLPSPVVRA